MTTGSAGPNAAAEPAVCAASPEVVKATPKRIAVREGVLAGRLGPETRSEMDMRLPRDVRFLREKDDAGNERRFESNRRA